MAGEPDADATLARLRTATMWLSRQMREPSAAETSITPSRYSTLWSVDQFGPLRMSELARLEKISKSSVTRVVSNLAADGLVEVAPDAHDGRSTLVAMTSKGKEVLSATSERSDALLRARLATFSEAEKVMLDAAVLLLERLVAPSPTGGRQAPEAGS